MNADERAIRQVHAEWVGAVNAADLAGLQGLMADDVVFLNPGRAPFGRDEFPAGFLAAHQQYRILCQSEIGEITVAGDLAYTVCRDSLSLEPRAGGEAMAMSGHRITIYRRQAGGRWLLARDAHTLSPAPG